MTQTNLQLNSAAVNNKGLSEKVSRTEDSYVELQNLGFFAVADEVGSVQSGNLASQMVTEILSEAFINLQEDEDATERMKKAIEKANDAIFQMSKDIPRLGTMATTFVGLHITENVATVAHVGGSRLYRIDADGNLYRETQNHLVHSAIEANANTPPQRDTISCALGLEETVKVNMHRLKLDAETTFLLCSDSVMRHIGDDELREILRTEDDASAICQNVSSICHERGAEDNLTAVVVKAAGKVSEFADDDSEEKTAAVAENPIAKNGASTGASSQDGKEPARGISRPKFKLKKPSSAANKTKTKESAKTYPVAHSKKPDSPSISQSDSKSRASFGSKTRANQSKNIQFYGANKQIDPDLLRVVFSVLPWALLGITLLTLIYLIWANRSGNDTSRDMSVSKTQNAALTSFEQSRRTVDNDPAKYIAASAPPKSVIDNYLLARAHFLQKNYSDAKVYLRKARDLLNGSLSAPNRKVLQNEILMLMAIVDTPDARETFEQAR